MLQVVVASKNVVNNNNNIYMLQQQKLSKNIFILLQFIQCQKKKQWKLGKERKKNRLFITSFER